MEDFYYLHLADNNYIKFDPVNQITNVFFDECQKQIFIVKSAAVSVIKCKESKDRNFSFCLDNQNPLIAIKFNSDNSVLAIQRNENNLELIGFKNNQIIQNSSILYETRKQGSIIYGFVWSEQHEFIVITADTVEIFNINMAKKQMKSQKSLSVSSNWFCYNRSNIILLSSNNGLLLTPILVKKESLTKLAPIQMEDGQSISERDVITGTLYDKAAILILKTTRNRTLEIFVYLLTGPSFKKLHVLKLGFSGRVAVSIIDSIIIIHHQTSKVSLLFDIALNGEADNLDKSVMIHSPLLAGKSIKPFSIKIPSVSLKENSMTFEMYSVNWIIFGDIIIDVKLGYLFKLELSIDKIQIGDKIKLVDFLMNRQNAKSQLMNILTQLILPDDYNEIHLPILEIIFNKLNRVYKLKIQHDLNKMQALPSPSAFKTFTSPQPQPLNEHPREIIIDQNDMLQIFNTIVDKNMLEKVLLCYIYSLVVHAITCEYDLSKMLVMTLVGSQKVHDLQQILSFQVLHESKPLACFILSLANYDPLISQMALDMLKRLNAHEIIVEILLEQGKIIDAIRLAKQHTNVDMLPARKFLDAALKVDNKMTFYSVFNFFLSRNQRLRGNNEFMKNEQCDNYVKIFHEMYPA
ncbi:unnamed protein product [Chironomus riparius]|uniref:Mic1 domain-containing protein n=1 Tax=Chironomus riparius TaxID=315576 RepID=A0A9N9WSP9_9DIPT|nr:unnamed protein product [Chironomus riparius]